MEECIHGLGPVAACTICNGRDKREQEQAKQEPRFFPATYSGHCNVCDYPILVGDDIAWVPDRPAVHEECWS